MAKIYPNTDPSVSFNISKRFMVPESTVVRVMLDAVPDGYHWVLEEETTNGETCGERLIWHPVDGSCCCQAGPSAGATSYDLAVAGAYRLIALRCDGTAPLEIDLAGTIIVTREIPDPHGVLAAKTLSENNMACCPQEITVVETANQIILTVDGVPTSIAKFVDCAGADMNPGAELALCSDIPEIPSFCEQLSSLNVSPILLG